MTRLEVMMAADGVFRRSPEGQLALDSRDKRMGARLRALMLMAEGKPMSQFAATAAALGRPPMPLNNWLGLASCAVNPSAPVAAVGANRESPAAGDGEDAYARFRTVSGLLREIAADVLGLKAFFFILKVEKAATLKDLEQLLPALWPAVVKARGADGAAALETQLRAMLQSSDGANAG